MPCLYPFIAGLLEVGWAIGLKYTHGFSRLWTGIGAVGSAVLGMILFNEPRDVTRTLSHVLILAGIVGLKLASGEAK